MRKVLRRHHGAMAKLARELDVSSVTITLWLKSRFNSQRLEEAISRRVSEILESELAVSQ